MGRLFGWCRPHGSRQYVPVSTLQEFKLIQYLAHPYLAFSGVGNDPMPQQILKPCLAWASNMNNSMNSGMGFTAAGEWSNAINDCGLFVNGVGLGTRYEGTFAGFSGQGTGDCSE